MFASEGVQIAPSTLAHLFKNGAQSLKVLYERMVELIMECEVLHVDETFLAILFSFAATCKANGVNYRQWLEDILIRINTTPASQIDSLLPQNWDLQPTLKYPGKATQTRL